MENKITYTQNSKYFIDHQFLNFLRNLYLLKYVGKIELFKSMSHKLPTLALEELALEGPIFLMKLT